MNVEFWIMNQFPQCIQKPVQKACSNIVIVFLVFLLREFTVNEIILNVNNNNKEV